jgi:malonate-semialdehyde dehydrogenase (acetylating)/methylmalonate-semialdehyde dehydrogenase
MKYPEIKNFINGKQVDNSTGKSWDKICPNDGSLLTKVPLSSKDDLSVAVNAAEKAFESWSAKTVKDRVQILYKYRTLLEKYFEDHARIIHEEIGKTIVEGRQEVAKSLELLEFACSMPQVACGPNLIVTAGVECRVEYIPLGVVASITPFNFPHMVPHWTFPNALALGNTMILKPSRYTPISALRIAELLTEAGLPEGVFNVVNGGREVVEAISEQKGIKAVTFVGSTPVAKSIYTKSSANFQRALTLGSANNHLILLPDANVEMAASNIVASYTGTAGQRCMSACVMVAVGNCDHIIEKIVELSRQIRPGFEMGAIITPEAKKNITGYIDRAEKDGAKIIVDGRNAVVVGKENGNYLAPTVIDHATRDMEIAKEENFGPVLTIVRANSLDEAIDIANSSPYGNGGSIFTQNGKYAQEFIQKIQAGMVGVNVGVPVPREPFGFGGWKNSIFGAGDITGHSSINFWTKSKKITTKWNPEAKQNWMS